MLSCHLVHTTLCEITRISAACLHARAALLVLQVWGPTSWAGACRSCWLPAAQQHHSNSSSSSNNRRKISMMKTALANKGEGVCGSCVWELCVGAVCVGAVCGSCVGGGCGRWTDSGCFLLHCCGCRLLRNGQLSPMNAAIWIGRLSSLQKQTNTSSNPGILAGKKH